MAIDFESLPHTADLKIRVYGSTLGELFKNALIGMFQSIGPQTNKCELINERLVCKKLEIQHTIQLEAADLSSLLVDFLSEALYFSDVYNEAYLDAHIKTVTSTTVDAVVCGIHIDRFELEIKAVTYHDLDIKKINNVWQTDIVFDI